MTEATPDFPSDGEDLERGPFLTLLRTEPDMVLILAFTPKQMHVWSCQGLSTSDLVEVLRGSAKAFETLGGDDPTVRRVK